MTNQSKVPKVVAHRGESRDFPENTRLAIEAALKAGGRYVEFDVQLSVDCVPIVIHDKDLLRTANRAGCVMEMTAEELGEISAGYQDRFGEKFSNERISSLPQIVEILKSWPDAVVFVELKRASINHFGKAVMLDSVLHELEPVSHQSVLISYDPEILQLARSNASQTIGWVFDDWDDKAREQAYNMVPDFLITDASQIPTTKEALWPGDWKWVVFEVNDPDQALALCQVGIEFIETNSVQTFAQHELFKTQLKAR